MCIILNTLTILAGCSKVFKIERLVQRSPAQCTVVQASPIRKHDRAIVARNGYAAWPVVERFYQKLCYLLLEFRIDTLMKNKMFTYVGYLNKHILKI